MRTLAIGDIHGCRRSLEALAAAVDFSRDDVIVTLGDYVDRGPDSKGVIDFLITLGKSRRVVPLRGNHEVMMLGARQNRLEVLDWMRCGGDATIDSYAANTLDDIPAAHWAFLEATRPFYENATHFFVHANAWPDLRLKDQPDFMLYWEFLHDPAPHQSGKTMICGHTSQKSGQVLDLGHAVCIDTFAHGGGWLTCLDPDSRIYWQANEHGETRVDKLE